MSVNKVILLGRLGKDPELKYTPTQMAVCNVSMATSNKFKDKSGTMQETTEWHSLVFFGKQAEACNKYLKKGRELYVEGRLQTRSWEKDGAKHYKTEVVVSDFQFIGSPEKKGNNQDSKLDLNKEFKVETNSDFTTDDIPF